MNLNYSNLAAAPSAFQRFPGGAYIVTTAPGVKARVKIDDDTWTYIEASSQYKFYAHKNILCEDIVGVRVARFPVGFTADIAKNGIIVEGTIADPTAGSDLAVQTVPAGEWWRLKRFNCKVVTDGTAGNRLMNLSVNPGSAGDIFLTSAESVQTASITYYYWAQPDNLTGQSYGWSKRFAIPGHWFPPGTTFSFLFNGIAGGDQINQATLQYEKWV